MALALAPAREMSPPGQFAQVRLHTRIGYGLQRSNRCPADPVPEWLFSADDHVEPLMEPTLLQ